VVDSAHSFQEFIRQQLRQPQSAVCRSIHCMMLIFRVSLRKLTRVADTSLRTIQASVRTHPRERIGRRFVHHDKYAIYAREVNSRFHVAFFAEICCSVCRLVCRLRGVDHRAIWRHYILLRCTIRSICAARARTRAAFRLDTDGGHRCHGFKG